MSNNDIDVGALSEAINDKMDRDLNNRSDDSGLRKLVESYVNGTSWYKVFDEIQSDGTVKKWCEQGDTVIRIAAAAQIITFPLPFADTNYTLIQNYQGNTANGNTGEFEDGYYDKTTTGFTKKSTKALTYIAEFAYFACGYIS